MQEHLAHTIAVIITTTNISMIIATVMITIAISGAPGKFYLPDPKPSNEDIACKHYYCASVVESMTGAPLKDALQSVQNRFNMIIRHIGRDGGGEGAWERGEEVRGEGRQGEQEGRGTARGCKCAGGQGSGRGGATWRASMPNNVC